MCVCVHVHASALLPPQLLNLEGFHTDEFLCILAHLCISLQKRKERASALNKNSKLTEDSRKKWMKNEMMSSEESDLEDPDVMVIHPLTWRSEYVSKIFAQIDR